MDEQEIVAGHAQSLAQYELGAAAFDLVYFVDTISRARPTPLALARYGTLRD